MIKRALLLLRPMAPSYRYIFKTSRDTNPFHHMKNSLFNFLKEEAFGDERATMDEQLNLSRQNFEGFDSLLNNYEKLIKGNANPQEIAKVYSAFAMNIDKLTKENTLRFLNLSTIYNLNQFYQRKNTTIDNKLLYDIKQNQTKDYTPIKDLYKDVANGILDTIFKGSAIDTTDIKSLTSFIFKALEQPLREYLLKRKFNVKEFFIVFKAFVAAQEGTKPFINDLGNSLIFNNEDLSIDDIDCFLNLLYDIFPRKESEHLEYANKYFTILTKVAQKINTIDTEKLLSIFKGILMIGPLINVYMDYILENLKTYEPQDKLEDFPILTKKVAGFLEVLAARIEAKGVKNFDTETLASDMYNLYLSRFDEKTLSLEEIIVILTSFDRIQALSPEYFSQLFEIGVEKMIKTLYTHLNQFNSSSRELKKTANHLIEIGTKLSSPSISKLKKAIMM